jgi:hypothetical protein
MEDDTKREESVDNQSSGDKEEPIVQKWHDAVDAIQKTTREAFSASPAFDPSSPSTFQTYWHDIFARLRDSMLADPQIPQYLTSPPVPKFTITLFDVIHGLNCPCCHPDVGPNIVLENEEGVTKGDLINGFIQCMYGDALPRVYIEPEPLCEEEADASTGEEVEIPDGTYRDDAGMLVYSASWMSACGGQEGEAIAYSDEPNIVLYCCPQDEYEKRKKNDE